MHMIRRSPGTPGWYPSGTSCIVHPYNYVVAAGAKADVLMAKITYINVEGIKHVIEVKPGMSVMEGAVRQDVPGIDADCGGACACATCHVYVDEEWLSKTGTRGEMETSMLEMANDLKPNSRLSCQIKVAEELDGLVVYTPKSQH
jgi:2Fe-2S ferredoxin